MPRKERQCLPRARTLCRIWMVIEESHEARPAHQAQPLALRWDDQQAVTSFDTALLPRALPLLPDQVQRPKGSLFKVRHSHLSSEQTVQCAAPCQSSQSAPGSSPLGLVSPEMA